MNNIWRSDIQHFILNFIKKDQLYCFLDLGCGYGYDLKFFKDKLGMNPNSLFVGIDKIERAILSACEKYSGEGIEFYNMDTANGLDFEDEKFDVVYSMDVMECITDKSKLVNEIYRVLKPGGQVICCHCDWDSIIYNGKDKELIKEILNKYSNWQQPWMDDADSWIGRRLWGMFNSTGMFSGEVKIFNIIETDYNENRKGYDFVKEIGYMVEAGVITKEKYERFVNDIESTARDGHYIYVQPIYIYSGVKA